MASLLGLTCASAVLVDPIDRCGDCYCGGSNCWRGRDLERAPFFTPFLAPFFTPFLTPLLTRTPDTGALPQEEADLDAGEW